MLRGMEVFFLVCGLGLKGTLIFFGWKIFFFLGEGVERDCYGFLDYSELVWAPIFKMEPIPQLLKNW